MEQIYHLKTDFPAVFLLNGIFCEGGHFSYGESSPLYVTVLPLDAMLIPYTVKILSGRVVCNSEFCALLLTPNGDNLIVLKPRYNYVYAPQHVSSKTLDMPPAKLFHLIKDKSLFDARALLSPELNDSVDDDSLLSFFDDYLDIISTSATFSPLAQDYYLVDSQNTCHPFTFSFRNGKIDNIAEG